VIAEGRPEDVAAFEAGQELGNLGLDGVRQPRVRRDEERRRVRAVLGLRDEVGSDELGLA
jgi:hypothetical protein